MKVKWFNREQLEDLGITDVSSNGEYLVRNGRLVHASGSGHGYLGFFFRNNGKGIRISAHRVVALWFFHEIPEGYEVDHYDHDTWNNRIENLRLLPSSENRKNQNRVSIRLTDEDREYMKQYMRQYRARKRQEAESLGEVGEAKQFTGT